MIKREYVEFLDVENNFECRLLVPVGMQIKDAFECSLRITQALSKALENNKKKEKEFEDGGENQTS